MQNNDIDFMQAALLQAEQAALHDEVPVGCVIVCDNTIIATGRNQPISTQDPTAHAEIIAIRSAAKKQNNYRLKNCALYVTLEPCAMCVGAMIHARIARLIFGASDPKTGAVKSVIPLLDAPYHNHPIAWEGGVMRDRCGALLTAFFGERRHK